MDVYAAIYLVSGFITKMGDIGHFDNPKQMQELAGYTIVQ